MRSACRFERELVPEPLSYFDREGVRLIGVGRWRSALCPFHDDTHPSLRVNVETGERYFAPETVERLQQMIWEERTPSAFGVPRHWA